jgi:hypothetical protein
LTPKRRNILAGVGIVLVLVVVVVVLQNGGGGDRFGLISADAGSSYLGVGLLVFLDAVASSASSRFHPLPASHTNTRPAPHRRSNNTSSRCPRSG